MKRGIIYLVMVLLFCYFVAAAPPSFHIFSGEVSCENGVAVDNRILSLLIYNDTDASTQEVTVSNGIYSVLVDADADYLINFSADGVYLNQSSYIPYGFSENVDFVLSSEHSYCEEEEDPPVDPPSPPGGGGGTTTSASCGDGSVNQDSEECDGSDLDDETCITLGFSGGALSCNSDCTFNTIACSGSQETGCGDGICQLNEDCSSCPQDCGSCDDWNLSDVELDMSNNEVGQVVSTGGDYNLIFGDFNIPFSVYDISNEKVSLDIDGESYTLDLYGVQNVLINDNDFQITYLDYLDDKAKVSFRKQGLRGVTPYPVQEVVYYIFGVLLVGVALFFGIRYLTRKNSSPQKNKPNLNKSSKQNLLAGPEE